MRILTENEILHISGASLSVSGLHTLGVQVTGLCCLALLAYSLYTSAPVAISIIAATGLIAVSIAELTL